MARKMRSTKEGRGILRSVCAFKIARKEEKKVEIGEAGKKEKGRKGKNVGAVREKKRS